MPVTPYRANLQDQKELYQFLLTSQQKSIERSCPQIVSISQEISEIDPLAVLKDRGQDRQHFYFEQRRKRVSIAAIDCAISTTIEGRDRFSQSQEFIQTCLNNTTSIGNLNLPFAGTHFFCSFSFFDQKDSKSSLFPNATLFIPKYQVSTFQNQSVFVANFQISAGENLERLVEEFCHRVTTISTLKSYANIKQFSDKFIQPDTAETDYFKLAVSSALASIKTSKFSKIVLANAIDVISPSPLNIISSINNLRQTYPDCYVFSLRNTEGKTFMGASPERLISISDRTLVTDALAGSAPRGKTIAEDIKFATQLMNSEKERREHQAVRNFIVECLSTLNITPQMLSPQLLKISNIQHLWTPIKAQILTNIHPLEIVAKLHPTPAVAGVPRDIALQHIRRYEHFDRCLYAAPLGWVDYQGNSEFIVGIRSALIEGCQARLYAGAGIVAGSTPEKELAEVQLKFQALLKALV